MSTKKTAPPTVLSSDVPDFSDQVGLESPFTTCDYFDSADSLSSFSNSNCDSGGYESAFSSISIDDCEDDVPDGYLRLELSSDTLNQLCGFFGDGVTISRMSKTVELSYAVCLEIFKAATARHPESNQLDETRSDEQIALELQLQYDSEPKKEPVFTKENRHDYKKLRLEFPGFHERNVMDIFKDNNYCYADTRDTLAIYAAEGETVSSESFDTQHKVASIRDEMTFVQCKSQWQPVEPRRKVENKGKEKVDHRSLSEAQETAKMVLTNLQPIYAKRQEFRQKAAASSGKNSHWTQQYYSQEAQKCAVVISSGIEEANEIVCDSNLRSQESTIDMHLLNVPNALKLLKQKLSQLDRDPAFRNKRSSKFLKVITGYGKNSSGNCKLKPAVKNWLDQHKYKYDFSNRGEFQVLCK